MIHIPTSIPPRKKPSPKREAENTSPSEIHRVVHEMVNHLTVMNLCCFKFRAAAAARLPAASLADIANMEAAVEQIAALLDDLTKTTTANSQRQVTLNKRPTLPMSPGTRSSTNVYPLFKP
jgi:hypothetical protein